MLALLEIIKRTTEFLNGRGLENPRLNAELLIGHALDLPRMQLYLQFERLLTEADLEKIRPLVKRRGQREPLQYILGQAEFFHIRLKVDRRALIPRPETEQLCELITQVQLEPPGTILDLGTGCGALALALATSYREASVTAIDDSEEALDLARENAAALGLAGRVRFLRSDWYAALDPAERFDLIVANPPYLSESEAGATEPEVRGHEPSRALSPGSGGTEALARIIDGAPRFLGEKGLLALETGIDQHATLRGWAAAVGLGRVESRRDLSGRDRHLLAWRS
jgi:release factor glutamine methyltransferase